ncbi:MAG: hypothetical protein ACREEH_04345 [Caulobacteraceae bacterium]
MANETLDQFPSLALPVQASDLIPILRAPGVLASVAAGDLGASSWTVIGPSGDTSGATDTAAIQTAISLGQNILLLPGVFFTNATLNVTSYASCGATIRGSGSFYEAPFGTSPPPSTTVIRPVSDVTTAMLIDGTPIGGYQLTWVQGFCLENLCIDMQDMADSSSVSAINQIQAWDISYRRVRIINDGTNKRGWKFNGGAFVTLLDTCQSNWIEAIGVDDSYRVTTLTVLNHDGGSVNLDHCEIIKFIGGAFQSSSTSETAFTIRNTGHCKIETDIEVHGTVYNVDSSVSALWLQNDVYACDENGATYMVGSPGNAYVNFDYRELFNSTYRFNLTGGGFFLTNGGEPGVSTLLSGASAANYALTLGRAGGEAYFGIAANANDFFAGTIAGDAALWNQGTGGDAANLWLGAAGAGVLKLTSAGAQVLGTLTVDGLATFNGSLTVSGAINADNYGYATATAIVVKPPTDGQCVTFENEAGTGLVVFTSNATDDLAALSLVNGCQLIGYPDGGVTASYALSAKNGTITAGAAIYPGAPAASPALQGIAGLWSGNGVPNNTYGANGDFYFRGDGASGSCIYQKRAGSWVATAA